MLALGNHCSKASAVTGVRRGYLVQINLRTANTFGSIVYHHAKDELNNSFKP